jgi:hypothetical protein
MSDDKKPRLELKFADGVNIPVQIVNIGDNLPDDDELRDEVAIEFGPNGEISTMREGQFSFKCRFDGGADVFDKLKKMHDDDIAKQKTAVENN